MSLGSQGSFFLGSSGAAGGGGYEIERSLRFSSGDSSYLNRTPSSAGNRKTWTYSFWIKYCGDSGINGATSTWILWGGANTTNFAGAYFNANSLRVFQYNGSGYDYQLDTTQVFRDQSAWYHFVIACDTTQATASNRIKVYVNGQEITTFSTSTYPTQNLDTHINSATQQNLGGGPSLASYLSAYLADIHFIDGQALAATDFGKFDSNSVWQPKEFAGTYGTNGFKLDFSDTSSDAALGTDSSGNGNDWTVNNLSVGAAAVDYSGNGQMSGPWNPPPNDAAAGFDGSLAGPDVPYAQGSTAAFTWTPSTPINYSTNVEMYVGNVAGFRYDLNGGGWVTPSTQSWNTIATGSGTITTIKVDRSGSDTYGWHAIKVDGTILVNSAAVITDALRDTPVNGNSANDTGAGGEITGNYATWNPNGSNDSYITYSDGNLDFTQTAASGNAGQMAPQATIGVSSGKWYWEFVNTSGSNQGASVATSFSKENTHLPSSGYVTYYGYDGSIQGSGFTLPSTANTYGVNDIIGVALDADIGSVQFFKNGVSQGTATNGPTNVSLFPSSRIWSSGASGAASTNFGQRAFAYTAPSGYKALCTANLSDPTIADGSTAFDAKLYLGDGQASNPITGLNMSPDLVWIKNRSFNSTDHYLTDIVRGAGKFLYSNLSNSESATDSQFTSTGFNSKRM